MQNFSQIMELCRSKSKKTISVACAQDESVLLAVEEARVMGIIDAILVGDSREIKNILQKCGIESSNYIIEDIVDPNEACLRSVSLVSDGEAEMIMKGLVDTSILLKAVLDDEVGLKTGSLLSHVGVFEIEGWDRLIFITDAAINIAPDLEAKKMIIENAARVARALGIENPKVACLCAKEKVSKKMPATLDADKLQDMSKKGDIKGCTVGGPFALDNAVSKEAAAHKGIKNPVAGMADILLAPDIEAGNILYKSLTYFVKCKNGGIVAGAKAPIILTSRAGSQETKLNAIILGALTADSAVRGETDG